MVKDLKVLNDLNVLNAPNVWLTLKSLMFLDIKDLKAFKAPEHNTSPHRIMPQRRTFFEGFAVAFMLMCRKCFICFSSSSAF